MTKPTTFEDYKALLDKYKTVDYSNSPYIPRGSTSGQGSGGAGGAGAGGLLGLLAGREVYKQLAGQAAQTVATPNIISAGVIPEAAAGIGGAGGSAAGITAAEAASAKAAAQGGASTLTGQGAGMTLGTGLAAAAAFAPILYGGYKMMTKKNWLRPWDAKQAINSKALNQQLPGYLDADEATRSKIVDLLKQGNIIKSSGRPNYMMDPAKYKPEDEAAHTSYRIQSPQMRAAEIAYWLKNREYLANQGGSSLGHIPGGGQGLLALKKFESPLDDIADLRARLGAGLKKDAFADVEAAMGKISDLLKPAAPVVPAIPNPNSPGFKDGKRIPNAGNR